MSTEDLWHAPERATPAQLTLANYMSELSEQGYFAGWLVGIEFVLWRLAAHPEEPFHLFGLAEAERLRALSKACGGWVYWDDGFDGLAFATTERWRQIFDAQESFVHHLG